MKKIVLTLAALYATTGAAQTQETGYSTYTYGNRTIVEFQKTPKSLSFKDENGTDMLYERINDSTYRLPKLVRYFTITANGKTSIHGEKPSSPLASQPALLQPAQNQATMIVPSAPAPVANAMPTPSLVQIPMMTDKGIAMVYAPASSISSAAAQPIASVQVPVQSSLSSGEKLVSSTKPLWIVKADHSTIEDVITDWAKQADYEVFYETQQLPISVKADRQIPASSFLDALAILGESYRNSAAPFQVIPTKYKQVIIRPMANGNIENQN